MLKKQCHGNTTDKQERCPGSQFPSHFHGFSFSYYVFPSAGGHVLVTIYLAPCVLVSGMPSSE